MNTFVNELLGISGDNFSINSQIKYNLPNDIDCIIDIVIENEETICFLENKVNSPEGERQLERYSTVLNNNKNKKKVYLRYCTKYYDKKEVANIDFKQIRWFDVYKMLENFEDNELVKEYLNFLRSEGMSKVEEFNFQDLIVLNNLNKTYSKINECFNNAQVHFDNIFNVKTKFNTITNYNTYSGIWKYKKEIFGEGYSEIYLGFLIISENSKDIPSLVVGMCSKEDNNNFNIFIEYAKNKISDSTINIDEEDSQVDVWFQEPLSNFLSSNNQFEEIEKWFIDTLDKFRLFKENTSDLDWKC